MLSLTEVSRGILIPLLAVSFATVPVAAQSFDIPRLQKLTLSNGIEVDFAPYQKDRSVRVTLIINSGNGGDLEVPPYTLATALSFARWGGDAADTVHAILVRHKAGISTSCGPSACFVELIAEPETLDGALKLMTDIVRYPSFSRSQFHLVREQTADAMATEAQKTDPARKLLREYLYGREHPLRRELVDPELATEIRNLTFKQLVKTFDRWVRPDNVHILVVGNLVAKHVHTMFERQYGDWERPTAPLPVPSPPRKLNNHARVFLIDSPTVDRAEVAVGIAFEAPERLHYSDLSTLYALARVLDQRMKACLLEKDRSTTAAATLTFTPWGPFLEMTFDPGVAKVDAALSDVKRAIQDLISGRPPLKMEIARAREASGHLLDRFAAADANALMTYYRERLVLNLPDHPSASIRQQIKNATPARVQGFLRNNRVGSALTWVIVGNARSIAQSVRELELGEITFVPP